MTPIAAVRARAHGREAVSTIHHGIGVADGTRVAIRGVSVLPLVTKRAPLTRFRLRMALRWAQERQGIIPIRVREGVAILTGTLRVGLTATVAGVAGIVHLLRTRNSAVALWRQAMPRGETESPEPLESTPELRRDLTAQSPYIAVTIVSFTYKKAGKKYALVYTGSCRFCERAGISRSRTRPRHSSGPKN